MNDSGRCSPSDPVTWGLGAEKPVGNPAHCQGGTNRTQEVPEFQGTKKALLGGGDKNWQNKRSPNLGSEAPRIVSAVDAFVSACSASISFAFGELC
jgi:hypothetical protein